MKLRSRRPFAPRVQPTHPTGEIALASLPLPELAVFMRFLGRDLVFALIHARPPRLNQAIKLADRCGLFSQANVKAQRYAPLIEKAIDTDFPEWRAGVAVELERRFGLHDGWNAPRDLWTLIGMQAWLDPQFRHRLAQRLDYELRSRLWYGVEPPPAIEFTPTLFWTLIALFPPPTGLLRNALQNLLPNLQQSPLDVLQGIARAKAEASQAALTVWDQWVLLLAAAQWQRDPARKRDLLWSRIDLLPLWDLTRPSQTPPPDLVVPKWFAAWLQTGNYLLTTPKEIATDDDE